MPKEPFGNHCRILLIPSGEFPASDHFARHSNFTTDRVLNTLSSPGVASRENGEESQMKRRRYQYGSLTKKSNRLSEDVWQFRFYETSPDGRRCRRSTRIGCALELNGCGFPTCVRPFPANGDCAVRPTGTLTWKIPRDSVPSIGAASRVNILLQINA